jgi:hypothetical protein
MQLLLPLLPLPALPLLIAPLAVLLLLPLMDVLHGGCLLQQQLREAPPLPSRLHLKALQTYADVLQSLRTQRDPKAYPACYWFQRRCTSMILMWYSVHDLLSLMGSCTFPWQCEQDVIAQLTALPTQQRSHSGRNVSAAKSPCRTMVMHCQLLIVQRSRQ